MRNSVILVMVLSINFCKDEKPIHSIELLNYRQKNIATLTV